MSVRLNVVVVQSPRMSSLQTGVIADIVIQLLGRPGIDVGVVTSLQPDDGNASDKLMLAGLDSDLAVIDWRSIDETLGGLGRLGLEVHRAPHALDPKANAVAAGCRRVYVFDLRQGFKADEVVHTLITILGQRRIVAVPLMAPKEKLSQPTLNRAASQQPVSPIPQAARPTLPVDQAMDSSEPIANSADGPERPRYPLAKDSDLDALVNSLNDIDL